MAFSDEMIRAAVAAGRYSDPGAARHIADTLIARRDRIGRAWMSAVNPVVSPAFDGQRLVFRNAAVDTGVDNRPAGYTAIWWSLDNATGDCERLGETRSAGPELATPPSLLSASHTFLRVDVSATGGQPSSWASPVRMVFKRTASGDWRLVGLDRRTEG